MEGCGEGRKQGGASRKGNRGGRDISLRHRDPLREKDIDLRHREREKERERERERAKHQRERGIWVWV